MSAIVEVTSFAEVLEALRASAKLVTVLDDESRPLREGTVLRIDGDAHSKRRRLLNRLVFRGEHSRYRETVLVPAIERNLAELRSGPSVAGRVTCDVVEVCARSLIELVAAMIGLDEWRTRDGMSSLVALQRKLDQLPRLKTQLRGAAPPVSTDELRAAAASSQAAKREFAERFYAPALEAHRALLARVEAGELPAAELPTDFLAIVAAHGDPAFDADPDLPIREAAIDLFHAGVGTSVGAVVHTLDELERWLVARPEDRERTSDPEFLLRVVNETLRLHAANPAEVRRATEDVVLCRGTLIRKGDEVALRTGIANRDASVFGPDADRFDPWRTVPPGVYRHRLAFGSGPHMCYGLPIAMGDEGVDGNIVLLVRRLIEAGARRDPDRPGRYRPGVAFADLRGWESYPVTLAVAAARTAAASATA